MGFEEEDFNALMENNIYTKKNTKILTREKLIRFAGNSIVVPVLEEIFRCINKIHRELNRQELPNKPLLKKKSKITPVISTCDHQD